MTTWVWRLEQGNSGISEFKKKKKKTALLLRPFLCAVYNAIIKTCHLQCVLISDDEDRVLAPTSEKKKQNLRNIKVVTVREKASDKPTRRCAGIRRRLDKRGPPFGWHGQSHFLFFMLCQCSLNCFCVDIWKIKNLHLLAPGSQSVYFFELNYHCLSC